MIRLWLWAQRAMFYFRTRLNALRHEVFMNTKYVSDYLISDNKIQVDICGTNDLI